MEFENVDVCFLRKVLAAGCGLLAETFFRSNVSTLYATCVRPQMEAHLCLLVGTSGQLSNICLHIMLQNWKICGIEWKLCGKQNY